MMSLTFALKQSRVMIRRNVRRSLRDPEAFFTALMLPVILMLLFVYVFGGDLDTGGKYVNYVVPGLVVLCAAFGAGTTAVAVATDMTNGIVDRFRSMPIAGSSVLVGHVVASLARNLVATTLVIGAGLAVGWRPTGSALDWLAAAAMIVLLGHAAPDVPALCQHRLRPRAHHAGRAARLRRAPAVHPDRRDHARTMDGTHLHRREHRARGLDRHHLVRRPPRRLERGRIKAVPAPHSSLRVGLPHPRGPLRPVVTQRPRRSSRSCL